MTQQMWIPFGLTGSSLAQCSLMLYGTIQSHVYYSQVLYLYSNRLRQKTPDKHDLFAFLSLAFPLGCLTYAMYFLIRK